MSLVDAAKAQNLHSDISSWGADIQLLAPNLIGLNNESKLTMTKHLQFTFAEHLNLIISCGERDIKSV